MYSTSTSSIPPNSQYFTINASDGLGKSNDLSVEAIIFLQL